MTLHRQRDLEQSLIAETVTAMANSTPAATAGESDPIWHSLAAAELPWAGIPEASGGAGGEVADLAEVIASLGRTGRSVPVVETGFVSGWMAQRCDLPVRRCVAVPLICSASGDAITATRLGSGWRVSGQVAAVPFARHAEQFLALVKLTSGAGVVRCDADQARLVHGVNLAGDPRDDVILRDVPIRDADIAGVGSALTEWEVLSRAALGRSVEIAGALRGVQELTVRYADERSQFGRPIAEFQAVAHHLALIAAEATAAEAVVALAVRVESPTVAGIAKARCSKAAVRVARSAHQVHGAIGTSDEYPLGRLTKRLWSWAADYGNERFWQRRLGQALLDGGIDLWPTVVASADRESERIPTTPPIGH
jgi:acyl-CoA dehydrogenase